MTQRSVGSSEGKNKGGGDWGNLDSQLAEFLAELPGVRSDPADGVVAEVELLQSQQAVEPALAHLCQVVVVQLPAGPHTQTRRVLNSTSAMMEELISLSVRAYRTSMLLRPQKAPSIRRLRPFLCILSERRACRPWNARPSTLRTRFLLSSLQHTQVLYV